MSPFRPLDPGPMSNQAKNAERPCDGCSDPQGPGRWMHMTGESYCSRCSTLREPSESTDRQKWLDRIPEGMTLEDAFVAQSQSMMELRELYGGRIRMADLDSASLRLAIAKVRAYLSSFVPGAAAPIDRLLEAEGVALDLLPEVTE